MSPTLRIAGAIFMLGLSVSSSAGPVAKNVAAPDFALKTLAGENLRLSEYRGQVVLITFWASWCGRCRDQLAAINTLDAGFADKDFQVLAISIDAEPSAARRVVDAGGFRFPILLDPDKLVARLYDPDRMPLTVLVGRYGNVRHISQGYSRDDERIFSQYLAALVAE